MNGSRNIYALFACWQLPLEEQADPMPEDGQDDQARNQEYRDYTPEFATSQTWTNRDDLLQHCRGTALKLNMVLTIKRSWGSTPTRRGSLLLACEKYGQYTPRKRQRVAGDDASGNTRRAVSKIEGCPFALSGVEFKRGEWGLDVIHGKHNHLLPGALDGHPYVGRMDADERDTTLALTVAGTPPKPILATLKMTADARQKLNFTSRRQVYNARAKFKAEARGDRTVSQEALRILRDKGYYYCTRRSPDDPNRLQDLFIAHTDARHLLAMFPYVVLVDSTYRTNA